MAKRKSKKVAKPRTKKKEAKPEPTPQFAVFYELQGVAGGCPKPVHAHCNAVGALQHLGAGRRPVRARAVEGEPAEVSRRRRNLYEILTFLEAVPAGRTFDENPC